jgi:hypothetical protein
MKRIEMFGPMGAGKSTLYKNFLKHKGAGNGLKPVSERDALRRIYYQSLGEKPLVTSLVRRIELALSGRPLFERLKSHAWETLKQDSQKWDKFINHVLSCNCVESADSAIHLRRIDWFIRDLLIATLVDNSDDPRTLIQHEGLTQRGIALLFSGNRALDFLEVFIELMPKPLLALHITAPTDVLRDRIIMREGRQASTLDQVEKALVLSEFAAKKLRKSGVQVIQIDTAVLSVENLPTLHSVAQETLSASEQA